MSIMVVLLQMIKLFMIMCIGYFLYKIKMLDDHTRQQLTRIILYVTTPALIIHSFIENAGSQRRELLGELFLIAAVMYILLPLAGIIIVLLLRVKKPQQGLYMFMTVFSNVGFMGFPVADALYGTEGVFYAAIFNCVFNICVFTVGVILINYPKEAMATSEATSVSGATATSGATDISGGGGTSGARNAASVLSIKKLLNPGILCCFIAVIIFLLRIPVPGVIMEVLDSVGGLTSPLAMILVGASLAMMNIKELFGDVRIYIYTVIRQLVLPVLAWPLISRFVHNELAAAITLILAAMPVANTAVLFATEYKRDEKMAAKGVFLTTLAAIVTIPLVVWVCFRP